MAPPWDLGRGSRDRRENYDVIYKIVFLDFPKYFYFIFNLFNWSPKGSSTSFCSLSFICRWHTNFCFISAKSNSKLPQALRNLEKCIADINAWMNSNSLQLNHSKCEFMLFGSKSQLNKLDIDSISVSGNDIPLSNSCRNLGVIFDSQMSMSKQTTSICKSVRYQFAQYRLYPKIPHSFCYRETSPFTHFLPPWFW